jgi:Tfp pilus assembly ATPase PilU
MAGMYSMNDLLKLMAQEGAAELRLEPHRPPSMLLHGKARVLDGPLITSDDVCQLFKAIATEEQGRELDTCGDVCFQYLSDRSEAFTVKAQLHEGLLSLRITNLSR